MKTKIIILITCCILTIIALGAIQGYFIYNTYRLTEREVREDINKDLLEMESTAEYDSLNASWMRKTATFVAGSDTARAGDKEYKKLIQRNADSLLNPFTVMLSKIRTFKKYNITYSNYAKLLLVKNPGKTDTVFKGKILLFGNIKDESTETGLSQGRWQSISYSREKDDVTQEVSENVKHYNFEIVTERYYSITNWQTLILTRMAGLLVFSVLLFVFVTGLFYWSIKNLLLQKKIADIKSDFINNITHEFQTPLATMNMAIKTLQHKNGQLLAAHRENTLNIIQRQNRRLQKLFSQVTDASLSTDNVHIPDREIITCTDIQEIINDFEITRPGITIICHNADDVKLSINRAHLYSTLVNLLDNAVKYGASAITVTVQNTNNDVTIAIHDNGPGIPLQEQELIFDKFYRIQKGNIHNTKGLGLGLYYVKQIAGVYNGTVTVHSKHNKGTVFTLILPAL